jgi:hypothetical protein
MTENESFNIYAITCSCIWIVIVAVKLVLAYRDSDRNSFGRWLLYIIAAPAAVVFISGFLFVMLLMGIAEGIPNLIFKNKDA